MLVNTTYTHFKTVLQFRRARNNLVSVFDNMNYTYNIVHAQISVIGLPCEYGCLPGATCNNASLCTCIDGFQENGTCHKGLYSLQVHTDIR